jgi:hypothetical protein
MIWNYNHLKKWNTEFTRNQDTFKNSYLLKNDKEKNISCTWTTISIHYNKLQKKSFKIHSYEKVFFGKKHVVLFYNNPIGSLYHVCTHWSTFLICNSVSQTLQCKKGLKILVLMGICSWNFTHTKKPP